MQKDNVKKFANTEAEARVLREKVKAKQVLGASSPVHGLTFNQLKEAFLAFQNTRAKKKELKNSCLRDFTRRLNYFETVPSADTYIMDLTRQQIIEAVYNKEGAKTPKTKLEYFVSLKAMLSYRAEEPLIFEPFLYRFGLRVVSGDFRVAHSSSGFQIGSPSRLPHSCQDPT